MRPSPRRLEGKRALSDVLVLERGPPRCRFRTAAGTRATVWEAPLKPTLVFRLEMNFCLMSVQLANANWMLVAVACGRFVVPPGFFTVFVCVDFHRLPRANVAAAGMKALMSG